MYVVIKIEEDEALDRRDNLELLRKMMASDRARVSAGGFAANGEIVQVSVAYPS